ncbi:hypothetical protein G9F73_012475 [Clostridium estertheticum]|uniref:hypothetical protein n=1 Tax=Clostridium estertheticum TaxID=238834 RepID=UPI0013EEA0C6|nr:hypothetical protein [Clostridium estertheticum]MBZ9608624.1 hypothetical protein [Clostridium estertheticum]
MNTFDTIMNNCPFLKSLIEDKITSEIEIVKTEKDMEIKELKDIVDSLILTNLGGN